MFLEEYKAAAEAAQLKREKDFAQILQMKEDTIKVPSPAGPTLTPLIAETRTKRPNPSTYKTP